MLGIHVMYSAWNPKDNYDMSASVFVVQFNPLEHTAGCETVETSMSFACNSSFLSVDGMTCLIPFES